MPNKPRKPRRWLRPLGTARDYQAYVLGAANITNAAIAQYVVPVIDRIPPELLRQDAIEDLPESAGWYEALRQGLLQAAADIARQPITARIADFSRRVSNFNKNQFMLMLRGAYGVDIFQAEPWLVDELKIWEAENTKLIKSIPADQLDRLNSKIVNQVRSGTTRAALQKEIEAEYDIPKNRAKLIANDQIGKLNGRLTEKRQKGIGVKKYKWRGSLDERERDSHVDREGVTFSWDDPPNDGHPGQPIRCRCTAEAELPLLADIEGLQFPDLTPARGKTLTQRGNQL